jgi:hypothetical protein
LVHTIRPFGPDISDTDERLCGTRSGIYLIPFDAHLTAFDTHIAAHALTKGNRDPAA